MGLRIRAVNTGTITCLWPEQTYLQNFERGQTYSVCPTWIIDGGKNTIVVDTGYPSVEWFDSHIRTSSGSKWQTATRKPEQEFPHVLNQAGLNPEDVDIVISTHLHFDHCGQNRYFKNARFYVQKREYEYAFAPCPLMDWVYISPRAYPNETPPFWGTPYNLITGDRTIVDGVKVVTLPGHTHGLQGVLVETAKGDYLICGDHLNVYENWEKRVPPGIHLDIEAWYDSCAKIESLGAIPIPHHDPKLFEKEKIPTFG